MEHSLRNYNEKLNLFITRPIKKFMRLISVLRPCFQGDGDAANLLI